MVFEFMILAFNSWFQIACPTIGSVQLVTIPANPVPRPINKPKLLITRR